MSLGRLPLRPRSVDLAALTVKVVDRHRARAGDRQALTIDVRGSPPTVAADPDRVERILTNLLDNAAKYSPSGAPIRLAVAPHDGGVMVAVRDDGIGRPPDATETIFEPFGRGATAVRDHLPGLGPGLSLGRSITERHGGRIWAECAGEGRGTTFRLWPPAETSAGC